MSSPKKGLAPLEINSETAKRRGFFLINIAYFAFWIVVSFLVIRYLFAWMIPFLLGFLVAALLQKPLKWLANKTKISKKFFSVIMVVLVVLTLAGLVALIGWQLIAWLTNFFNEENVANIQQGLTSLLNELQNKLGSLSVALPDQMGDSVTGLISSATSMLGNLISEIAPSLLSSTIKLPSLLVSFIMWILASIFLSVDFDAVTGFLKRQIPTRYKPMARAVRDFCYTALFRLGRAYLLLMFITFVELSIGLSILGVAFAIPLAMLIAVIDILPVLGTGTVLIPWSIISLIFGDFRMFIGTGLLYIIITVIRNILEPKIVSQQIGLHPVVTLFFMLLGLRAVGVLGMFLVPIAVIILKKLHDSGYIHLWN